MAFRETNRFTITTADTEQSVVLGTIKSLKVTVPSGGRPVRVSFVTGEVASRTSTVPRATADKPYEAKRINASVTLYVASSQVGQEFEVEHRA